MEVVSSCPMHVMGFVWQSSSGTFAQTIVAKATFVLEPGHAKLAPTAQWEAIHEVDRFVQNEPTGALFAPTDRVPYKQRVDVLLVGSAYAPGKQAVRSLVTKLEVGDFAKAIEVVCDRGFRPPDERLLEGPRFTKMPLDWTRAAGGPGTTNPVGMRFDAKPDPFGLISMPNLQPAKTAVTKGSDTFAPIGYGPIAPTWPGRTSLIERFSGTFVPATWDTRPLPQDFAFGYFQAASPDQQLDAICPDERLVLVNLHPQHAHLETLLPGVCPRAVVHRASGEREDVMLVADTLWIDSDRGICTVVWRGNVGLRSATEEGVIAVALVDPVEFEVDSTDDNVVETIPPGLVQEEELAAMTMVAPFGTKPKGPAMPFVSANLPERAPNPVRTADDGALPWGPSGLSGLPPAPIAMGQITLPAQSPASSPTVPEMVLPVPAPAAAAPVYVAPPPPVSIVAGSTTAPSVWAHGPASDLAVTKETIGAMAVGLSMGASSATAVDRATQDGALAASNAAAGAAPWDLPKRETRVPIVETDSTHAAAHEVVQLLWYDAESIVHMRRVVAWKSVFDALDKAPRVRNVEVVDGAREPWEIEDREEVFEVLTQAPRTDAKGLDEALEGGARGRRKFVPPMVVLTADMELPFDELAVLRAAMSAAVPVVTPADKQLEGAVSAAKEFVQTPGLSAAPGVCEGLTGRIREAFVKEKKAFPTDYLDVQVERVVLAGRHYQKREVFGGMYVRSLLWLSGEKSAQVGYLPADVATKLPMWKRFRARVIAEVHWAQDQYEVAPKALKVVSVARVG